MMDVGARDALFCHFVTASLRLKSIKIENNGTQIRLFSENKRSETFLNSKVL